MEPDHQQIIRQNAQTIHRQAGKESRTMKRPSRRDFLKTLGVGAAALSVPSWLRAAGPTSDQSRQPNILYIFTDQQYAEMMSCAGNPYLKTPAMDSLAANGARFTLALAANPVCVPARVGMMTGVMPSRIGMEQNEDMPQAKANVTEAILAHSLGRLFRNAGYETAYGGKVHLPMTPAAMGFDYITKDERAGLADDAHARRPLADARVQPVSCSPGATLARLWRAFARPCCRWTPSGRKHDPRARHTRPPRKRRVTSPTVAANAGLPSAVHSALRIGTVSPFTPHSALGTSLAYCHPDRSRRAGRAEGSRRALPAVQSAIRNFTRRSPGSPGRRRAEIRNRFLPPAVV